MSERDRRAEPGREPDPTAGADRRGRTPEPSGRAPGQPLDERAPAKPDADGPTPGRDQPANPLELARKAVWHPETAPMTLVRPQVDARAKYRRRRQFRIVRTTELNDAADTTLRLGAIFLAAGAPTSDVEAAVFAAGTALGLEPFEVDITNRAITLSVPPSADRPGLTTLRVVRAAARHHARLAAAHSLVVDLTSGRVTREELGTRLARLERMPRPYPRWFVTVAWGVLAGSLVVRLGGGWLAALIAFVSAAIVDRIGRVLNRHGMPQFFLNATGAFIATSVAVLITYAEVPARSSLVVAGGIIALLPGMPLVVAAQEAMGTFPVTAAARLVELSVATAGIVAGVLGGLAVAGWLGVTMEVAEIPSDDLGSATLAVVAAGVAAAANAVGSHAPPRVLVPAGLGGLAGLAAAKAVGAVSTTPGVSEGIAAIVVGVVAVVLATRLRVPPVLLVVPGIVPLLPGLASYQGLLELSQDELALGTATLIGAATVALALAAGVLLGELLVSERTRLQVAGHGPATGTVPVVDQPGGATAPREGTAARKGTGRWEGAGPREGTAPAARRTEPPTGRLTPVPRASEQRSGGRPGSAGVPVRRPILPRDDEPPRRR